MLAGDEPRVPVLLGIGHRGSSRQARRPDLRRGPRRHPGGRPERPRRVRDARHDRPRHGRRRDHDLGVHRHPGRRPQDDHRDRVHGRELRHRRRHLRRGHLDPGAVGGHRPGRRRRARASGGALDRRARRARRRGPGDDVRLRLPRDRRADAAPDRDGASARQAPRGRPQGRRDPVPATGRQESGHDRVRRDIRQTRRHRADQRAAPRGGRRRDAARARRPDRGDRPGAAGVRARRRGASGSWSTRRAGSRSGGRRPTRV